MRDPFGEFWLPQKLSSQLDHLARARQIYCHLHLWIVALTTAGSQDKVMVQGVSSTEEMKASHVCRCFGSLLFDPRTPAVHVMLLSMRLTSRPSSSVFQGQYSVFAEPRRESTGSRESHGSEQPHSGLAPKWWLETISDPSVTRVGLGSRRAEVEGTAGMRGEG